jgi:hypothetical protein
MNQEVHMKIESVDQRIIDLDTKLVIAEKLENGKYTASRKLPDRIREFVSKTCKTSKSEADIIKVLSSVLGTQDFMLHQNKAYICVDINTDGVFAISRQIKPTLKLLGIPFVEQLNTHVSVAYCEGAMSLSDIEVYCEEICQIPMSLKVSGLELLRGLTTPYDYIVANVVGEELDYAHGLISSENATKLFSGGFKKHITLFQIDKETVSKEDAETLSAVLESGINTSVILGAASVSVFDSERKLIFKQEFQKSSIAA